MKTEKKISGFTLIELLVVIAIITMLIAILIPGMGAVKRQTRNLRQKSHFHSIEIGLELFQKDYDDYPDSTRMPFQGAPFVYGAQHLTEAIAGRDLRGFEPESKWYAPLQAVDMYNLTDSVSMNRRKEIYMQLRDFNAFVPENVYDPSVLGSIASTGTANGGPFYAPFFSDVFKVKQILAATTMVSTPWNTDRPNVWAGSPILYFKANTRSRTFYPQYTDMPPGASGTQLTDYDKWIYNYDDNGGLFAMRKVDEPSVLHKYDVTNADVPNKDTAKSRAILGGVSGLDWFYESITNTQTKGPYNPSTYILMSAGWDGIFGTKDDITNF